MANLEKITKGIKKFAKTTLAAALITTQVACWNPNNPFLEKDKPNVLVVFGPDENRLETIEYISDTYYWSDLEKAKKDYIEGFLNAQLRDEDDWKEKRLTFNNSNIITYFLEKKYEGDNFPEVIKDYDKETIPNLIANSEEEINYFSFIGHGTRTYLLGLLNVNSINNYNSQLKENVQDKIADDFKGVLNVCNAGQDYELPDITIAEAFANLLGKAIYAPVTELEISLIALWKFGIINSNFIGEYELIEPAEN